MTLRIDPTSPAPPYEQLREQVEAMVRSGELTAGDRLPTVRRLAGDMGIAPGTVARGYRELELDGLLETRGRAGTFIVNENDDHAARAAARSCVKRIRSLGLPVSSALAYVECFVAGNG